MILFANSIFLKPDDLSKHKVNLVVIENCDNYSELETGLSFYGVIYFENKNKIYAIDKGINNGELFYYNDMWKKYKQQTYSFNSCDHSNNSLNFTDPSGKSLRFVLNKLKFYLIPQVKISHNILDGFKELKLDDKFCINNLDSVFRDPYSGDVIFNINDIYYLISYGRQLKRFMSSKIDEVPSWKIFYLTDLNKSFRYLGCLADNIVSFQSEDGFINFKKEHLKVYRKDEGGEKLDELKDYNRIKIADCHTWSQHYGKSPDIIYFIYRQSHFKIVKVKEDNAYYLNVLNERFNVWVYYQQFMGLLKLECDSNKLILTNIDPSYSQRFDFLLDDIEFLTK